MAYLSKSQIPTKNKTIVIDNYSPNYDYIIEGDKVYYSQKNKNQWVDISDNEKAQLNLLRFINDNYQFKGYEDNEQDLYNKIIGTPSNKSSIVTEPQVKVAEPQVKVTAQSIPQIGISSFVPPFYNSNSNNYLDFFNAAGKYLIDNVDSIKSQPKQEEKSEDPGFWYEYNPVALLTKATNYIARQREKRNGDEIGEVVSMPEITGDTRLRTDMSITGDTIKVPGDSRRYFIPEILNTDEFIFGTRNRGQVDPINSGNAPITIFSPFKSYEKTNGKPGESYIGIDSNGHLKVGDFSIFNSGDSLSRTYTNKVIGFKKDSNGNIVYKNDAVHGNGNRDVPVTLVMNEDGSISEGSLNILTGARSRNDKGAMFGNVAGGRVLAQVGDKTLLLSGSIEKINNDIENLKQEFGSDYVTLYTLDNGSYNRGLRTYDGKFTTKDLKQYDSQNNGGGNFLYIMGNANRPMQFTSDTVRTPNIRTENDNSYKLGHGLTNELKGVVLHHTGDTSENPQNMIKLLTTPGGNSAHVLIGTDGSRTVLADPTQVTFHAGESMFNGRDNVNDFMLGIEFQGDTNKKDLTPQQIASAVEYLRPIVQKYQIPLENIVTHQMVRDEYNKNAQSQGKAVAKTKPDINQRNYAIILNELLKSLYYTPTPSNYLNMIGNE